MLLASRERYNSSRTWRSIFCASNSAPKFLPSCRTPRMIWEIPMVSASGIKTLVSGTGLQHGVERVAGQHRHNGGQRGVPDRAQRSSWDDPAMPPGVRPNPPDRSGPVIGVFAVHRKFSRGGCYSHGQKSLPQSSDCESKDEKILPRGA